MKVFKLNESAILFSIIPSVRAAARKRRNYGKSCETHQNVQKFHAFHRRCSGGTGRRSLLARKVEPSGCSTWIALRSRENPMSERWGGGREGKGGQVESMVVE